MLILSFLSIEPDLVPKELGMDSCSDVLYLGTSAVNGTVSGLVPPKV